MTMSYFSMSVQNVFALHFLKIIDAKETNDELISNNVFSVIVPLEFNK